MSRPIPEIRAELHEIADQLYEEGQCSLSETIHKLAEDTRRVPCVRKAKPTSDKMTAAKRDEIWEKSFSYPEASQQEIAVMCNVTAGRVSETLAGKWGHLK